MQTSMYRVVIDRRILNYGVYTLLNKRHCNKGYLLPSISYHVSCIMYHVSWLFQLTYNPHIFLFLLQLCLHKDTATFRTSCGSLGTTRVSAGGWAERRTSGTLQPGLHNRKSSQHKRKSSSPR